MALRRVFVDRIEGSEALATGRTAHHLARSARLRPGETVEVSDQSAAYRAITAGCSPTEVRFRIVEQLPAADPAVTLDAALAIIKFPRFDWAVEKLTEFGVRSVIPIVAARSDTKLVAAAGKRAERWRRIAFEAAQQARCLAAPTVKPLVSFDEFIESCESDSRILAVPGGLPMRAPSFRESCAFLVGPEGGWTDEEQRLAQGRGFVPTGLSGTVLRSETAAVALAAIGTGRCAGDGTQ